MRPWSLVALIVLSLLAVVFRYIWTAARRRCAFTIDRVDVADALGRLARFGTGTEIDILSLDLRLLVGRPAWRDLIERWLRKGARVRYLVQEADHDGRKSLRGLAAGGFRGRVELFVLKADERGTELALDARDFHFVLFRGPDQLWLEGGHARDGLVALDCEYVPQAADDERWAPRNADFEALLSLASAVKLKA
jgi:hypothetical protein